MIRLGGPRPPKSLLYWDDCDVEVTLAEHGAGYGYTKCFGNHPLVATRAGTGEILLFTTRKWSAGSSRRVNRFIDELAGFLRRSKATGAKVCAPIRVLVVGTAPHRGPKTPRGGSRLSDRRCQSVHGQPLTTAITKPDQMAATDPKTIAMGRRCRQVRSTSAIRIRYATRTSARVIPTTASTAWVDLNHVSSQGPRQSMSSSLQSFHERSAHIFTATIWTRARTSATIRTCPWLTTYHSGSRRCRPRTGSDQRVAARRRTSTARAEPSPSRVGAS
jgi:hypothetical protein